MCVIANRLFLKHFSIHLCVFLYLPHQHTILGGYNQIDWIGVSFTFGKVKHNNVHLFDNVFCYLKLLTVNALTVNLFDRVLPKQPF